MKCHHQNGLHLDQQYCYQLRIWLTERDAYHL